VRRGHGHTLCNDMTRIVTTHYRYKRPAKRKAVALEGPAVVPAKSSRRLIGEKVAAEMQVARRGKSSAC
jgi:hypothetical protein